MSEFAPEYSKKERFVIIIKHLIWVVPLMLATQYLFFPWFERFVPNSHCYKYGWVTGTDIVFYGLFVGLPLLFALLLLLMEGSRVVKIIQLGQSPLPGEKVFKATKYTYGYRAKIKPFILFLVVMFFLGLSIKGVFSAKQVTNNIDLSKMAKCSVN